MSYETDLCTGWLRLKYLLTPQTQRLQRSFPKGIITITRSRRYLLRNAYSISVKIHVPGAICTRIRSRVSTHCKRAAREVGANGACPSRPRRSRWPKRTARSSTRTAAKIRAPYADTSYTRGWAFRKRSSLRMKMFKIPKFQGLVLTTLCVIIT